MTYVIGGALIGAVCGIMIDGPFWKVAIAAMVLYNVFVLAAMFSK